MVQIETMCIAIGLVMLIGLASENAILMLRFFRQGRVLRKASPLAESPFMRPGFGSSDSHDILLHLSWLRSLWTATGEAPSRDRSCTTVIGGMLAATLIAVFIICALVLVERFSKREGALPGP